MVVRHHYFVGTHCLRDIRRRILLPTECVTRFISPLFGKKGTIHNMSVLKDKQKCGSVLHMTNVLKAGYPLSCFGDSWRDVVVFFTYHRRTLAELFGTHNSVSLKVAVSPVLQERGNVIFRIKNGFPPYSINLPIFVTARLDRPQSSAYFSSKKW